MDDHTNGADLNRVGLLDEVIGELAWLRHRLAVDLHRRSRVGLEPYDAAVEHEPADAFRCRRSRQDDVVGRSSAGGMTARLEEVEAGNRRPVLAITLLVLGAPVLRFLRRCGNIDGRWI